MCEWHTVCWFLSTRQEQKTTSFVSIYIKTLLYYGMWQHLSEFVQCLLTRWQSVQNELCWFWIKDNPKACGYQITWLDQTRRRFASQMAVVITASSSRYSAWHFTHPDKNKLKSLTPKTALNACGFWNLVNTYATRHLLEFKTLRYIEGVVPPHTESTGVREARCKNNSSYYVTVKINKQPLANKTQRLSTCYTKSTFTLWLWRRSSAVKVLYFLRSSAHRKWL